MYENEEKDVLKILDSAKEPLATMEIMSKVKGEYGRDKLMKILLLMKAKGMINGKDIEGKRAVWIWWRLDVFK